MAPFGAIFVNIETVLIKIVKIAYLIIYNC